MLIRCRLRLSKPGMDIFQHTDRTYRSVNELQSFPTVWADKTKLDDEAPVLHINLEAFRTLCNVQAEQIVEDGKSYSTPRGTLISFLEEVFTLVNKMEKSWFDISDRHMSIKAYTVNNECRLAAAEIAQPRTLSPYDVKYLLPKVSPVKFA